MDDLSEAIIRSRPRRQSQIDKNVWITSYADLVTQLLVFFLVLIAASQINSKKLEQIQNRLSDGSETPRATLESVANEIERILKEKNIQSDVDLVKDENGIAMILKDGLLFSSGEAEISTIKIDQLKPILAALKELPQYYQFSIEGHTDDNGISTVRFKSNWELSAARASSVLQIFLQNGFNPDRLSLYAFGDQRPLLPNRDAEGQAVLINQSKNRRVVIRVR